MKRNDKTRIFLPSQKSFGTIILDTLIIFNDYLMHRYDIRYENYILFRMTLKLDISN